MQEKFIQAQMPFDNLTGMKEYLLVIQPDDEVYNKVSSDLRNTCAGQFIASLPVE